MGKRFTSLGFAPVGVLVLLFLAGGLALAVTRVTDLRTVLNLPKAAEKKAVVGRGSSAELAGQASVDTTIAAGTIRPIDGSYQAAGSIPEVPILLRFEVTNNGSIIENFKSYFWVKDCGDFVIENIPKARISSGRFSFDYNGYVVSATFESPLSVWVTEELKEYLLGCSRFSGTYNSRAVRVPSVGRYCTIGVSGDTVTAVGVGTSYLENQAMRVWVERKDGTKLASVPGGTEERNNLSDGSKYHYNLGSCNANAGKECRIEKKLDLPAGDYTAHCDLALPADVGKCTGNPFCSINGGKVNCTDFKSCSGDTNQAGGDNASFTVQGTKPPPFPEPLSRSCSVNISGTTVTATAKGDRKANEAMRVWLEKENGSQITPLPAWTTGERNYLPDGGKWHYALGSCNATNTKPCTVSKAVTNLTAGKYTAHCDIIGDTSPEGVVADKDKCTGNPFCSVNGGTQACTGWKSCGDRDKASLTAR